MKIPYEVRVRTVLSPAVVRSLPVSDSWSTVPRRTLHRLRVNADRDIADVVRRLAERGVEVLDIRAVPVG